MTRKLAAMFLLSLLTVAFLATTVTFGADQPVKSFKHRASVPARFAPTYSFPGLDRSAYTAPAADPERNLRGTKAGEGILETIGSTTYDYQHNCTMPRQVEHRAMYSNVDPVHGHYVHFDWMAQEGDTLGTGRGVGYQAYELATCTHVFVPGGIRIEGAYAGYVSLDAHSLDAMNTWAVPMAHENDDGVWSAKAYWDFTSGGPVFGVFTTDFPTDRYGHYQNNGTGPGNENIWPVHDWDINGDDYVLHLVTTESGGDAGDPQTLSYYRRVGSYGTGLGIWSSQRLIDTVMNINVTVASSPITDKVAIAWVAPVDYLRDTPDEFDNQYENDVWFAIASDNGAAWASISPGPSIGNMMPSPYIPALGGNLTTYDELSMWKAYCDMGALWYVDGANDYLQVVWGTRRWDDTTSLYRRQGAIFHWNQFTDSIRTVATAMWDTGGACFGHAWGTDVAKMNISQCEDRLYCSFTQFGSASNPCLDVDNVNNVVNGYLYMSVYDPAYDAWDRPQRVTPTAETPAGCIPGTMAGPGTCNSEYWASMARYGRYDTCKYEAPVGDNVLDIVYINDYAPGGCVQTESGVWTVNDVNWAVYPCRLAVPEPLYDDDAGPGYGLCVGEPILVMGTTDDTSFVLTMINNGILANSPVSIDVVDYPPTTTVTATPNSGISIPAKGGTAEVDIDISTAGATENSTVACTLKVTYQVGNPPTPATKEIPVCITVTDNYFPLQSEVIATTCKQLRVYNNGQMSNNSSNESLDFTDDPDDCADLYLYDGSPIACRDDGGTVRCYFTIYDNDYASDHAMRQVDSIVVNTDSAAYVKTSMEYITGDSAIRFISEYYTPTAAEDCGYVIEKILFWNQTEVTLNNVAVGQALDWDIPSYDVDHAISDNESDYDSSKNLIYQYSCFNDPCDTTVLANRFGGVASGGAGFKNYMTLENDVYVYTSGPFGNEAPLPDDTIYGLMTGVDGFSKASLDSCEDLMTLVTFDVYELQPFDTQCVVKILVTSKDDAGALKLKADVDAAKAFIAAHPEVGCGTGPCDCIPGDANNDGQVNVGDAVYLISYVFKGGPAPIPYATCSGDANCDCQANVGDAVFIIAYVFKGGPPPCSCEEWVATCGQPIF